MHCSVMVFRCRPNAAAMSSTVACSYACSTPHETYRIAAAGSLSRRIASTSSATVACMLREITAPRVMRVSVTCRNAMPLIRARANARISCSSE